MKIAFASELRKGSNPDSIYAQMVEMDSSVEDSLCYCSLDSPKPRGLAYDVGITSGIDFKSFKLKPNRDGALTVLASEGQGFRGEVRQRRGIDIYLAASEHEKERYVHNGCKPEDVFVTGKPNIDLLHGSEDDRYLLRYVFLTKERLCSTRGTLLYAPTRGFFMKEIEEQVQSLLAMRMLTVARDLDCNLVLRLEGEYSSRFGDKMLPDHLHDVLGEQEDVAITSTYTDPDYIPSLIAADALITDLSNIALDYLALNRPIVFVESSLGWFDSRGWYCPLQKRPGKIVRTTGELAEAVLDSVGKESDGLEDVRRDAAKRFLGFSDGKNAERAVGVIMNEYDKRIRNP